MEAMSEEDSLALLLTFVEDGFKLSVKYEAERAAFLWSLSSPAENWTESKVLTCRHIDPHKPLVAMAWALKYVYNGPKSFLEPLNDEQSNW